ncbi:5'-AMP-activated protein kinase beta subunit, interation domain-containing protein, partial [Pilaira anomala]
VPTIITWTQGGNNVYVTGTFNGWKQKIKLVKSMHDFSAVLDLPPGTHRLKFIVDDEWKCSNDMETATDPDGNLVNYLQVMDEDEESETDEFELADSKKYSNIIPPELLQLAEDDKKSVQEWEKKQPQPPTLPPHLEKVLLNSNTVSEEDNSVLHEPNHVTLNHLYACSIKDNIMALATTSRYRKKVEINIFIFLLSYLISFYIIVRHYNVLSSRVSKVLKTKYFSPPLFFYFYFYKNIYSF